jgi:hypothetical protein
MERSTLMSGDTKANCAVIPASVFAIEGRSWERGQHNTVFGGVAYFCGRSRPFIVLTNDHFTYSPDIPCYAGRLAI